MPYMSHIPHAKPMSVEVKNALSAYPELLQKMLNNRGITDQVSAEKFLHPHYDNDTHDPFLLHDMDKAVVRLLEALEKKEKIAVYADFDADGIPGAVILHDFFHKIGHENFVLYIPHRHEEGYGVHADAVRKLAEEGVQLMITVDVGITYATEIALAQELGIDVIVTDHHEPNENLPQAVAGSKSKIRHVSRSDDLWRCCCVEVGVCGA
jgi:single-stranded-DNA-specific exonuclease